MINFDFDKNRFLSHKGYDNLTADNLKGSQPVFIFYLKENENTEQFDVLHFDWSMTSSVREQEIEDVKSEIERYNPAWVFKFELSKEQINSTTHLMTGYYDLLRDKWVELERKKVQDLTTNDVFDIMVNAKVESNKLFFNDKELYLKNLEISSNNSIMPFLGHKDLEKRLCLKEIMDIVINWYQEEKEEVESNTDKETGTVMIPLSRLIDHFNKKGVPQFDNAGKVNIHNLFGVMRAHDMFQFGIYDTVNKKCYDEASFHLVKEELSTRKKDFIEVSLLNERFLNVFGKIK